MMANGAWTEAHAKRQNELNAIVNEKERARQSSLSVEKKEAHRARQRIYNRVFVARNRDAVNAAERQRYANMKLDPVRYKAYKQKRNQQHRKRKLNAERERKRARTSADDDDDDDEESADVQGAILGDNVIVISDDEDESAVEVADDSSGSDVEGIEFVSSDDEQ
jgi:hypothetical protein